MPAIKKTRLEVFARDGFKCQYCGVDLLRDVTTFYSATVDHVWPRSRGGERTPENLVACCAGCNGLKKNFPAKSLEEAQGYVAGKRAEYSSYLLMMLETNQIEPPTQPGRDYSFRRDVLHALGAFSGQTQQMVQRMKELDDWARSIVALLTLSTERGPTAAHDPSREELTSETSQAAPIAAAVELQAQSRILEAVEAATKRTPEPAAEPAENDALDLAAIRKDTERILEGKKPRRPGRAKCDPATTCFEVPLESGSTMQDARRAAAEIMPEIDVDAVDSPLAYDLTPAEETRRREVQTAGKRAIKSGKLKAVEPHHRASRPHRCPSCNSLVVTERCIRCSLERQAAAKLPEELTSV